MIKSQLNKIFIWRGDSRYGHELFKHVYNWKLSSQGVSKGLRSMRTTDWQLQVVIL